ncbi:hypothetical protein BDW72DRAFT_173229 [Aspergillus terricola var. indicus]
MISLLPGSFRLTAIFSALSVSSEVLRLLQTGVSQLVCKNVEMLRSRRWTCVIEYETVQGRNNEYTVSLVGNIDAEVCLKTLQSDEHRKLIFLLAPKLRTALAPIFGTTIHPFKLSHSAYTFGDIGKYGLSENFSRRALNSLIAYPSAAGDSPERTISECTLGKMF